MVGSGWDYRLAYGDSQKFITSKKTKRNVSTFYKALMSRFFKKSCNIFQLAQGL